MVERMPDKDKVENLIILSKSNTEIGVKPNGLYVNHFKVGNWQVLMSDQEYDVGDKTKRRGGIPLLFPNAGPHSRDGNNMELDQHGFARSANWQVADLDQSSVTLKLDSSVATQDQYPFDFSARAVIKIDGEGSLNYQLSVTNRSNEPMPIAPGLHPYFQVQPESKPEMTTNIDGFDPKSHKWGTAQPLKMPEEGINIQTQESSIRIEASDQFKKAVVWDEKDKPHVCIEPWVGGLNAISNPEEQVLIAPGETEKLWVKIIATPNQK